MKCDQCEMLSINGIACHESGCVNARSRWDASSETWIAQRECSICGYDYDAGDICCNDHEEYRADSDDDAADEPARICIVDGQYGIYVPTRFAKKFRHNRAYCVMHVTPADWDELERGPDVEGYWDLWDEITRDAEIIDNETGRHYYLEQDGDLFLVAKI